MRLLSNDPLAIERAFREPWDQPRQMKSYTVANLPSAATWTLGIAYASNGRKGGEGVGAGTGCPVWSDGTNWLTFYGNATVAA